MRSAAKAKGSGLGLPSAYIAGGTMAAKRRVKSSMSSIRMAESRWADVQTALGTAAILSRNSTGPAVGYLLDGELPVIVGHPLVERDGRIAFDADVITDDLHAGLAGKIAQVGVFIDRYPDFRERVDPRLTVQVFALDERAIEVEDRALEPELAHCSPGGRGLISCSVARPQPDPAGRESRSRRSRSPAVLEPGRECALVDPAGDHDLSVHRRPYRPAVRPVGLLPSAWSSLPVWTPSQSTRAQPVGGPARLVGDADQVRGEAMPARSRLRPRRRWWRRWRRRGRSWSAPAPNAISASSAPASIVFMSATSRWSGARFRDRGPRPGRDA